MTTGVTAILSGSLIIGGSANQNGGSFELSPNTSVYLEPHDPITAPGGVGVLGIRDGILIGTGLVHGSLVLGNPDAKAGWNPILAPRSKLGGSGEIVVSGDFEIFQGRIDVGITGPTVFDRVRVNGYAKLHDTAVGVLQKAHDEIPANTKFAFLQSGNRKTDFNTIKLPDGTFWPNNNSDWDYGTDAKNAWFVNKVKILTAKAQIKGRAFVTSQ